MSNPIDVKEKNVYNLHIEYVFNITTFYLITDTFYK